MPTLTQKTTERRPPRNKYRPKTTPPDDATPTQKERIVYVELADDLTEQEKADMAAMRKEFREHPENFISIDEYMAKNGITEEDLAKVTPSRLVYNI